MTFPALRIGASIGIRVSLAAGILFAGWLTPREVRAADDLRIGVRSGEHAAFTRLVTDWPRNVDYRVIEKPTETRLVFSAKGQLDLARLQRDLPKAVSAVKEESAAGQTVLIVRHAPLQNIHHFRSGTSVALDLRYLQTPAAASPNAAVVSKPRQPVKRSEIPQTSPPAKKPAKTNQPVQLLPKSAQKKPVVANDDAANDAAGKQIEKPAVATVQTPVEFVDDGRLRVGYRALENGAQLEFRWPEPIAAAAFTRAGHLWILFDAPRQVNLAALESDPTYITHSQQIRNNRAVVLRFRLAAAVHVATARQGAAWTVTLNRVSQSSPGAIGISSEPYHKDGARVFVSAINSGKRVLVYDPEVGDELQIVPILEPHRGIVSERRYPQFYLLRTHQGIVVKPLVEDLIVSSQHDGVTVGLKRGLVVSPPDAVSNFQRGENFGGGFKGKLLNLTSWKGDPSVSQSEKRGALLRSLAQSRGQSRVQARWQLARYHFANAEIPEAHGYVALLTEAAANAVDDPKIRAVRGISNLLLYRSAAAYEDLSHTDLNRYSDIALWRGLIDAQRGNVDAALKNFSDGKSALEELPRAHRGLILRNWAEMLMRKEDAAGFDALHALAKQINLPKPDMSYFTYYAGRFAAADNDRKAANKAYKQAAASDVRGARALASRAKIEMALAHGDITPVQAIEKLESLYFAWRGDDFEVTLKKRIAGLSIEQSAYRKGLTLYRQLVTGKLPDKDEADVTARMGKAFEELFLGGASEKLDPVRALALFYDFQELTPFGKDGDQIIRNLADRLVQVDLLSQAERLLTHQVTHRLKGGEKAKVSARLAYIHLLNRRPDAALNVLDRSNWDLAGQELRDDRRHLRARALIDLDRDNEAVVLLKDDTSAAALAIKADLFWQRQDWQQARTQLAALAGERHKDPAPLTRTMAATVMKLAVAHYLANDKSALEVIAGQYADLMAASDFGESFALLTHSVDPAKTDFRKLPAAIAAVDGLDAFLSAYKEKYTGS